MHFINGLAKHFLGYQLNEIKLDSSLDYLSEVTKYLQDLTTVSHTWAHHEELLVFYQLLESEKPVLLLHVQQCTTTKPLFLDAKLGGFNEMLNKGTHPSSVAFLFHTPMEFLIQHWFTSYLQSFFISLPICDSNLSSLFIVCGLQLMIFSSSNNILTNCRLKT